MRISLLTNLVELLAFSFQRGSYSASVLSTPARNTPLDTHKGFLKTFIIPRRFKKRISDRKPRIAAIIPSFKPEDMTVNLINDLVRFNPALTIVVVDDSTPESYEAKHRVFGRIRSIGENVIVLRTSANKMKAGALNYGLSYLMGPAFGRKLDAILTLDDDVMIEARTVKNLIRNLFEDDSIGAVCSQSRVLNKNKNILTRLQGLEYLGFNATRIADEGFFYGPLVMHGMLTAFRVEALADVGTFAEYHLIEDYEITARLKGLGWHVRLAPAAYAWTKVPETFGHWWRQRTRWAYGGITVISKSHWQSVIQDFLGHGMFVTTLVLVAVSLILSDSGSTIPKFIPQIIFALSLFQVVVWYVFQLWLMRFYSERDFFDVVIRVSLFPEFVYSLMMTLALMGAYVFDSVQSITSRLPDGNRATRFVSTVVEQGFSEFGYAKKWGTR